jgi:hypothetical protein
MTKKYLAAQVKNDNLQHPIYYNINKGEVNLIFGGTPDTSLRHSGWESQVY